MIGSQDLSVFVSLFERSNTSVDSPLRGDEYRKRKLRVYVNAAVRSA